LEKVAADLRQEDHITEAIYVRTVAARLGNPPSANASMIGLLMIGLPFGPMSTVQQIATVVLAFLWLWSLFPSLASVVSLASGDRLNDVLNRFRSKSNEKAMAEGAAWLGNLGAAIINKDLSALVRVKPLGVEKFGDHPLYDQEATLIGDLKEWVRDEKFKELLVEALKERVSKKATPKEVEETADLMIAMILGKGVNHQVSGRALFYFEGTEKLNRAQVMAAILKAGDRRPTIMATPDQYKLISEAVELLKKNGLLGALVMVDERTTRSTMTELMPLATTIVVTRATRERWGWRGDPRIKALEEFVPIEKVDLENITRTLRAALEAA
jgi:hypothetical protein